MMNWISWLVDEHLPPILFVGLILFLLGLGATIYRSSQNEKEYAHSVAHQEGRNAANKGQSPFRNPYSENDRPVAYREWLKGYADEIHQSRSTITSPKPDK